MSKPLSEEDLADIEQVRGYYRALDDEKREAAFVGLLKGYYAIANAIEAGHGLLDEAVDSLEVLLT